MKGSKVAKRYARALLQLADRSQVEKWGEELDRLAAVVEAPELMTRLASPELSSEARQQAMGKVAENLELSFPLRSFAVVIARHGRIGEIGAITEAYRDLMDNLLGRARATLTFAAEPSAEEVARVVQSLEKIANRKIIPTVRTDTQLLGGVTAELGGKIYDGSLATRLGEARGRLAGENG